MNALTALTTRQKVLFYMNFSCVVHRRRDCVANDADAVIRDERRCPTAFRCMQFAKRTGKQTRIVFRFATHEPHLFLIMHTENHKKMHKATYFSHKNRKNGDGFPPEPGG